MTTSYKTIITISLPGTDKTASAYLTLLPTDTIDMGEQTKLLHDCTVADLQRFAEAWENDVWAIYDSVKLIELAEDDQIHVDMQIVDESGETRPLPETWLQSGVVLEIGDDSDSNEAQETVSHPPKTATPSEQAIPIEEIPTTRPPSSPQPTEPEPDVVTPRITVSQAVPVHQEREANVPKKREPILPIAPTIIPSRARVRVAGKQRPMGDPTWAAVDILIDEPPLRAAQAHALSSLKREVAGVLIGSPPEKQPDGRYVVHIIDTIVAKYTVMQGASVTYTPESWRYMNDKLAEKYPDETAVMVGWYHTHPGFGIFLSGMDQFIHQNFFTQIWHVAQVLDPVARTSGFFCWDRQKKNVRPYDFPWPVWAASSW